MEGLVGQLDKKHMRPLQKAAYQCMAACCDSSAGQPELLQCTSACERKVQVANQLISASIRDFQERLQRCVQVRLAGRPPLANSSPRVYQWATALRRRPAPALPMVQRCQDKAQELLSPQPSDKDIARAQDALASCAADCATEYQKQIPKLQADVVERLKQIK